MCDKHSLRKLTKRSDVNPDAGSIRGLFITEETPLTAEELMQKKKQKEREGKEMEFIREYVR